VELFEALEDAFDPAIYLGSFDKCECDCNASYWGFKAWYPLVSHHIDPKLSDEGVGSGPVTIKE